MSRIRWHRPALAGCALLWLAGCASLPPGPPEAEGQALLARLVPEVPAAALGQADPTRAQALLGAPLTRDGAVELALRHSPALAALRAGARADEAGRARAAGLPDPVLSIERMAGGGELAITRALSLGLLELLTWPQRQAQSGREAEAARLRLAGELLDQVAQVQTAWVQAVATAQQQAQSRRVLDAAEAGAELARRMQAAGNFSPLQRARQQLFEVEARTALLADTRLAQSRREALVRAVGLDTDEAARLRLPDRLPPLPAQAVAAQDLGPEAARTRLDLRLAQAELDAATEARGLGRIASLGDVELGLRQERVSADGALQRSRGAELSLRLPLADGGARAREALDARTEAAWWRREAARRQAASQLREAHGAWQAAWTTARQHRDDWLPLRQEMAEQTLLAYNGMLIGVFELLADAREQAQAVRAAIESEAGFWQADVALQMGLLGRPAAAPLSPLPSAAAPARDAGH